MCPASMALHDMVFLHVRVKAWHKATCNCGSTVFLSQEWKPELHGLTYEQVKAMYPQAAIV